MLRVVTRLVFVAFLANLSSAGDVYKFKKVLCEFMEPNFLELEACTVLPSGALDMAFKILKPITEIVVDIESTAKLGDAKDYSKIFTIEKVDFCGLMSGKTGNPLLKNIIDMIQHGQNYYHECPYVDRFEMRNFEILDDKFFALSPSGLYHTKMVLSNKAGKKFFVMNLEADLESPLRFG